MLNLDRRAVRQSTDTKQDQEEGEEEKCNTLICRRVQLSNRFFQGIQTIRKWVVYIITVFILILFVRSLLLLSSGKEDETDRLANLINQLMQIQSSIQPISEPKTTLYNESEIF